MKLRNYAQYVAIFMVHMMTLALRVNVVYHVRRLSTGYKRTETRGVSLAEFDNPVDALRFLKAVPNAKQENYFYFILAEARFGFTTTAVAETDPGETATEEGIGNHGAYEATVSVGPGVHPAASPAVEPGRVLADRGESEKLPDAETGAGDRERN